jgi:ABC-2 type transport system ATP-binding protein
MAIIEVNRVCKDFHVHTRRPGILSSVKSLFWREYEVKKAVQDISFQIAQGELVGYIGPNGAGKSTTVKMLSGILVPTSGSILVDGRTPHLNRQENARHMGVVFGQRSQLYWDLPMVETFDLYRKMYRIDEPRFRENVAFYVDLLDMQEFLHRPVRQLSLGQKMRANLAVALLHDPKIVYLDEPTIGLDVVGKSRIRRFLREVNEQKKTTVILTTHDMDDIEEICNRIIMIHEGRILFDGLLADFKRKFSKGHMLTVECAQADVSVPDPRLRVIRDQDGRASILFQPNEITVVEAVTCVMQHNRVLDLGIREPEIEEIIREFYEDMKQV